MKNRFLMLILFCLPGFVFANNDEQGTEKVPGYIITKAGKKVTGKVIPGNITDNEVKVKFIATGTTKVSIYKPKDILGYGFEKIELNDVGRKYRKWMHYERHDVDYPPKPFASKTVFIQREIEGALNLYCYYIEVRNDPKQPFKYIYYYKEEGDTKMKKIEKDEFGRIAKNMFKDYTALSTRVGKQKFEYRNLERMVRDFNYWTVNQHDADTYRVALKE